MYIQKILCPSRVLFNLYILTYSELILYQVISLVAFINLWLLLFKVENLHEKISPPPTK